MNFKFAGWRVFLVLFSLAAVMVIAITIMDGYFDWWYLLVPGIMVVIGAIQVFWRRKG
jgi:hypothetical protein